MIRSLINRTGSNCGSSLNTEMAGGSFFTTGDTFDCSQTFICNASVSPINHITGSTGNSSSLTDCEICCGRSRSGNNLNCSSGDIAS